MLLNMALVGLRRRAARLRRADEGGRRSMDALIFPKALLDRIPRVIFSQMVQPYLAQGWHKVRHKVKQSQGRAGGHLAHVEFRIVVALKSVVMAAETFGIVKVVTSHCLVGQ